MDKKEIKSDTLRYRIERAAKKGMKRLDRVYRALNKKYDEKEDQSEPYVEPHKNHLESSAQ